jgi:hypothetical protein
MVCGAINSGGGGRGRLRHRMVLIQAASDAAASRSELHRATRHTWIVAAGTYPPPPHPTHTHFISLQPCTAGGGGSSRSSAASTLRSRAPSPASRSLTRRSSSCSSASRRLPPDEAGRACDESVRSAPKGVRKSGAGRRGAARRCLTLQQLLLRRDASLVHPHPTGQRLHVTVRPNPATPPPQPHGAL